MFVAKSRELGQFAFLQGGGSVVPLSMAAPVIPSVYTDDIARQVLKRALDLLIAVLALTLLSPLMLLAALAIRLTSSGPALFRQRRVGQHERLFTMYKFRTMRQDANRTGVLQQATRDDPRVTWIGRILRRTSFDEVPQFINVLLGEMSVVGPRPHAPGTCAGGRPFERVTHRYGARHCVKPGMTGLAQVRGWRGETDTEEKLLHRLDSDLEYIATWSPLSDLMIVARTVGIVLRMRNAY